MQHNHLNAAAAEGTNRVKIIIIIITVFVQQFNKKNDSVGRNNTGQQKQFGLWERSSLHKKRKRKEFIKNT